jgi:hypothetical protein
MGRRKSREERSISGKYFGADYDERDVEYVFSTCGLSLSISFAFEVCLPSDINLSFSGSIICWG